MFDMLVTGGWVAMGPLTVLAALNLGLIIYHATRSSDGLNAQRTSGPFGANSILHIGVFCLFLGLLAQSVGLYQAFSAIEMAADISPGIVVGGLKVSLIAPIYGALIFAVSGIAWFFLKPSGD